MYSKQLYKSCSIKRGSSQIEKSAENIISWLQSSSMVEYLTHKVPTADVQKIELLFKDSPEKTAQIADLKIHYTDL